MPSQGCRLLLRQEVPPDLAVLSTHRRLQAPKYGAGRSYISAEAGQQYDAAVASIQAQAAGLWNEEAVLAAASTATSSAYYWQGEFGGSPSSVWKEPFYASVQTGTTANVNARGVAIADLAGCAGSFFLGRKMINVMRIPFTLMRKVIIPGGLLADCVGIGAITSLAELLT
jgi:hypothetical protein